MIDLPLSVNPDEIYAESVARAQLVEPLFVPRGFHEQTFRMWAGMAAEINGNLADRLQTEAREIQGDLLGIPVQDGVRATSTVTVTAIDTVGHTLPEGSRVWIGSSAGDAIEAATMIDLVIPAASSSGSVAIECVDVGESVNGASGTINIDALDWVSSVVLDDPLAGGVDAETVEEYSTRLPEETQLLAVAVSLPADAATLCRRNASVAWAYAVDHYDSTTNTSDLELTFSVVVAGPQGLAVAGGVLTTLDAELQAKRETNYVIRVTNATYTAIDVTAEIVPRDGWEAATVIANAEAALTAAVSPDTHLTPPYMDPNYLPPTRIYTTDLIAACKAADGVLHVIPSTFEIGDGSTDYIDLASPIHLPEAGTITVTAA